MFSQKYEAAGKKQAEKALSDLQRELRVNLHKALKNEDWTSIIAALSQLEPKHYSDVLDGRVIDYCKLLPFILCTQDDVIKDKSAFLSKITNKRDVYQTMCGWPLQKRYQQNYDTFLCMCIAKLKMMSLDPKVIFPNSTTIKLITSYFTGKLNIEEGMTLLPKLKAHLGDLSEIQNQQKIFVLCHTCSFPLKDLEWDQFDRLHNPKKYILSQGSINKLFSTGLIATKNQAEPTLHFLHWAFELNRPFSEIQSLYKDNKNTIDLNAQDMNGDTLLHLVIDKFFDIDYIVKSHVATRVNDDDSCPRYLKSILEWLLNQDSIQLDVQNNHGHTPLRCALDGEKRTIKWQEENVSNKLIQAYLSLPVPNPNPALGNPTETTLYNEDKTLIPYLLTHSLSDQLMQLIVFMNTEQLMVSLTYLHSRALSAGLSPHEKKWIQPLLDFTSLLLKERKVQPEILHSPDIFFLLLLSKMLTHDFQLTSTKVTLRSGNHLPNDAFKLYQCCETGWIAKTDAAKQTAIREIKTLLLDFLDTSTFTNFLATSFFAGNNPKTEQPFYEELLSIIEQCPLSQSQEEKQTPVKVTPTKNMYKL